MPKLTEQEIKCPQCGAVQRFRFVEQVNAQEDPEWKPRVLDGSIFDLHCTACGEESRIGYPFLYHDPSRKLMIFLTTRDDAVSTMRALMKHPEVPGASKGYTFRAVHQPYELTEKILVFEQGLDDRIIELLKMMAALSWKHYQPGQPAGRILLTDPANLAFTVVGESVETPMCCHFKPEDYAECENRYAAFFPKGAEENLCVDQAWVAKLLTPTKVM